DGNPRQIKWILRPAVDTAEARAATAESGGLHQISICIGAVIAPPVRERKQIHRCRQPLLQLDSRAEDLCARVGSNAAKIDVGARMCTDVEPYPVQRSNLIPRHPGIADAMLRVPPWHHLRFDPPADDEKCRR